MALTPSGGGSARLPTRLIGTHQLSGVYSDVITLTFRLTSFNLDQALFVALPVPTPGPDKDVHIRLGEALRESQDDKEVFQRTAVMQPQQQYLAVHAKLDQAYDDRLAARITDELWLRKSAEWEAELGTIRRETARHWYRTRRSIAEAFQLLTLSRSTCWLKATKLKIGWEAGIRAPITWSREPPVLVAPVRLRIVLSATTPSLRFSCALVPVSRRVSPR